MTIKTYVIEFEAKTQEQDGSMFDAGRHIVVVQAVSKQRAEQQFLDYLKENNAVFQGTVSIYNIPRKPGVHSVDGSFYT